VLSPAKASGTIWLVEVEDSYTLVPLDQPARLAQLVRELTRAPSRFTGRADIP
jgi:hypothetical protein